MHACGIQSYWLSLVDTEQVNVSFCWSANTAVSNVTYELILTSPAVLIMSCSSYLDSLRDGRQVAIQLLSCNHTIITTHLQFGRITLLFYQRLDFHKVVNLLIVVQAISMFNLTSLSVDEILLPRMQCYCHVGKLKPKKFRINFVSNPNNVYFLKKKRLTKQHKAIPAWRGQLFTLLNALISEYNVTTCLMLSYIFLHQKSRFSYSYGFTLYEKNIGTRER